MKKHGVLLALMLAYGAPALATDLCFGAVGKQCGSLGWEGIELAACAPIPTMSPFAVCAVSGGSMTHDPCCARIPQGKVCGTDPEQPQFCAVEWNRAVNRFIWGYQWARVVDTSKPNTSGNVVRADYCAKPDRGVHKNDASFCCSRESRKASFWDRLARPNLRICR
jgi:hypothetical protein